MAEEDPIRKGLPQDTWSEPLIASDSGEYALKPTGNDEDGWDYGDASPDDDLDNADWPKRTPDTWAALEAQVAVSPRRLLFLRGPCWYVWLDYKTREWTTDKRDAAEARGMLSEQFPPGVIQNRGEDDGAITLLYEDAVAFLQKAGVKTQVVG
jgi:hypothetical protein